MYQIELYGKFENCNDCTFSFKHQTEPWMEGPLDGKALGKTEVTWNKKCMCNNSPGHEGGKVLY